jgi:hypothetical protein
MRYPVPDRRALLDEALRTTSVLWLRTDVDRPERARALWFTRLDGGVLLVCGPDEQPDPGLTNGAIVQLVLRGHDDRARAVEVDASVRLVDPGSVDWSDICSQLCAARLNLVPGVGTGERWPERWQGPDYVVAVLSPTLG